MAGVFSMPNFTIRKETLDPGVPTFKWDDFSAKGELGSGSFGTVSTGEYNNEVVVVKKLKDDTRESKRAFLKEARLLHKVKGHRNIANFIALSVEPNAIMMEYVFFDFEPFGLSKKVTSLSKLIQVIDDLLDFKVLKSFQLQIARDIAEGLSFLHENGIVHRDLKPENVLVSNQHYSGELEESLKSQRFNECPVKCKLADFGESRATYLQTRTLLESKTHRINRGTPVFMAPEAHLQCKKVASHDDLKKADIWAFGLTMYCLINPDIDNPYEHLFAESGLEPSLQSLRYLLEKKQSPKHQPKYEHLRVTEWWKLEEAFDVSTKFDPELRPLASTLLTMLFSEELESSITFMHLAVSQSTALEKADCVLAEKSGQSTRDEEFPLQSPPENDGTNACVFLCLAICNYFLSAELPMEWKELKVTAENIIIQLPFTINTLRNIEETYEPISAYSLLRDNNLVQNCVLSEEFIERQAVFSVLGRDSLIKALSDRVRLSSCAIGLYTCDPYTFVVGIHQDALFLLDTHQINETLGGNNNGILAFTENTTEKSCKCLVQWIHKRLTNSGVSGDQQQSLSWITVCRQDSGHGDDVIVEMKQMSSLNGNDTATKDSNPYFDGEDGETHGITTNEECYQPSYSNGAGSGSTVNLSNKEVQHEVIDLTSKLLDNSRSGNAEELNSHVKEDDDTHIHVGRTNTERTPSGDRTQASQVNISLSSNDDEFNQLPDDRSDVEVEETEEETEYYNGNLKLPVYTTSRTVLKPQEVMELLIKDKESLLPKVCTSQPLQVQHHRTFIVDLNSLSHVSDIKCDDMGVWINNSSHKFNFIVDNFANDISITKCSTKNASSENAVTLKREYFSLKSYIHDDVRKRVDTIILSGNELYRYCLVQYYFKNGKEHPIELQRHGNSKMNDNSKEYVRTWESTKVVLEKASQHKSPRNAVHHVIRDELGGIESCGGVGQIPRNRQQSSDLKRNRDDGATPVLPRKNLSGKDKVDDPWYLLLNASKRENKDKQTAFVRDVRVGGEPLCVLTSNRQLNDLKRFCCDEKEFKPLTVDPTFNIGQFNVTPISYQHLLVETKEGKHPTLIGPVLIHERKTEETYSTFASSLKTLEPGLSKLMAFGTDDEKALENGFNCNFERAVHLLCEIHLRKNIERKLVGLGITGKIKDDIISDVFGKQNGDVFESGLSDSSNEKDFNDQMVLLKKKWSSVHKKGAYFHDWFMARKASEFLLSVISPVRQRAGLGSPPARFTTNRSERTNGVIQEFIKQECGRGKVDEFVFAMALRKLIDMQEKEVELAVVGQGEYKLQESFKDIYVPASRWSKMTDKQMKAALRKVHTLTVQERSTSSNVSAISRALDDNENPLIQCFAKAGVDWIPRDVLALMIAKASSIESMAHLLPGTSLETVIVPSSSNPKRPHIVVFLANGKCECQNCPGYSSAFVCAHAIAASVKVNRLNAYLKWLVTTKRKSGGINFTKAITYGMPAGRGKKPNQAPRKRTKTKHPSVDKVVVVPRNTPQNQMEPTPPNEEVSSNEIRSAVQFLQPSAQSSQNFPNPHPLQNFVPQPSSVSTYPSFQGSVNQPPVNNQILSSPSSHSNYPSPEQDTFIIYLLGLCPHQTAICFGCRNSLKPGGSIGHPPADLVIVSKMMRKWTQDGQVHSRAANVYFHCVPACVQQKQPYFHPCHSFIPRHIAPLLCDEHWLFLKQSFGNMAIR